MCICAYCLQHSPLLRAPRSQKSAVVGTEEDFPDDILFLTDGSYITHHEAQGMLVCFESKDTHLVMAKDVFVCQAVI